MNDPPRGRRGPKRTAPRDAFDRVIPKNKRLVTGDVIDAPFVRDESAIPDDIKSELPELPAIRVNGKWNVSYYSAMLGVIRKRLEVVMATGTEREAQNLKAFRDIIISEAAFNNIHQDSVVDNRPESVKIREARNELLDTTFDLLEKKDAEYAFIDRTMVAAMTDQQEVMESIVKKIGAEAAQNDREYMLAQRRLNAGKAWRDRIAMARRLKDLARNPIPKCFAHRERPIQQEAMKASHLIRYMLYTMRSNLSERQAVGGTDAIIEIVPHLYRMSLAKYLSVNNLQMTENGVEPRPQNCRYSGLIEIIPPGHCKTTMAIAFYADRISRNPYRKLKIGHAKEKNASDNLVYLSSFFKTDNPTGRRNHALFENLPAVEESTQFRFNLRTAEKSRSPTISANGATAKVGGDDCSDIWFDDFVDVEERDSETLRESKKQNMNAWTQRLRGVNDTFHLSTATAWHEDDANMARVTAVKNKKLNIYVLKMACNGPSGRYGVPPFAPLWPKQFPASFLRQEYEKDPLLYSATYMSNPRTEELQIVKKLRFFDPASETHKEFMGAAMCYLSVDPAATAREKSDKAGVIYAALGDVTDGDRTERRLRILDARQITADPEGAKQFIYGFAIGHKVDYVAIEQVGFSGSMITSINNELGIDCIPCPTMSKSKELRLKAVAALLENKKHSDAHGGAVVEFPGVRNQHGTIVCDPQFEWLERQFYRFGSIKDDHGLDAVNQLVAYLTRTGELQAGTGFVTDRVREKEAQGDIRILSFLKQAKNTGRKRSEYEEESEFFAGEKERSWTDMDSY